MMIGRDPHACRYGERRQPFQIMDPNQQWTRPNGALIAQQVEWRIAEGDGLFILRLWQRGVRHR